MRAHTADGGGWSGWTGWERVSIPNPPAGRSHRAQGTDLQPAGDPAGSVRDQWLSGKVRYEISGLPRRSSDLRRALLTTAGNGDYTSTTCS